MLKLSRTWLLLVNCCFGLAGLGLLVAGIVIYHKASTFDRSFIDSPISILSRLDSKFDSATIAVVMFVYGSYLILMALIGLCCLYSRSRTLLLLFLIFLMFYFIASIVGGASGIAESQKTSANYLSLQTWPGFTGKQKDIFQQSLGCCGFKNISDAYTGPSTSIYASFNADAPAVLNAPKEIPNTCVKNPGLRDPATYPSCQSQLLDIYRSTTIISAIMLSVGAILSLATFYFAWVYNDASQEYFSTHRDPFRDTFRTSTITNKVSSMLRSSKATSKV
jgi:hypothetical protein